MRIVSSPSVFFFPIPVVDPAGIEPHLPTEQGDAYCNPKHEGYLRFQHQLKAWGKAENDYYCISLCLGWR